MFEKLFDKLKNRSSAIIFATVGLNLLRLLFTSWCSTRSKVEGYFYSDHEWHSCRNDFPGAPIFLWANIGLMLLSAYVLFVDYIKLEGEIRNFKSINVSRVTYYLSLLLINFQIESIASAPPGLKITDGPEGLAFNTFVWAFPIALAIFSAATYSITKKLEWVISWN